MQKLTLAFGADHAGYALKQELVKYAKALGHNVIDFGTDSTEPYDYPLVVPSIVKALREEKADFGILVCGSGIGVDIVANRYRGIRSALCHNVDLAKSARSHNNANILSLGSKHVSVELANKCLNAFLETPFSDEERHHRRVEMLDHFM